MFSFVACVNKKENVHRIKQVRYEEVDYFRFLYCLCMCKWTERERSKRREKHCTADIAAS